MPRSKYRRARPAVIRIPGPGSRATVLLQSMRGDGYRAAVSTRPVGDMIVDDPVSARCSSRTLSFAAWTVCQTGSWARRQPASSTSSAPQPRSEYDRYAMERGSGSGHSAYAAAGIAFGRAALAFAWGAPSSVNVSANGYHRSVNISQPADAVSSPLRPIASSQTRTSAALHSITWSARPRSESGKVTPRVLAVVRLINSSTFVTCWTGRSAGLSPLSMRPV